MTSYLILDGAVEGTESVRRDWRREEVFRYPPLLSENVKGRGERGGWGARAERGGNGCCCHRQEARSHESAHQRDACHLQEGGRTCLSDPGLQDICCAPLPKCMASRPQSKCNSCDKVAELSDKLQEVLPHAGIVGTEPLRDIWLVRFLVAHKFKGFSATQSNLFYLSMHHCSSAM